MHKTHTMFPDGGESSLGSLRGLPIMIDELTPEPVRLKCPLEELTLCEQVSSVTEEDKRVLVTDDVFQELNGWSRNRKKASYSRSSA